MDDSKALGIVSALANGVNPVSGEVFPADSAYQSPDIVRALYAAVRALEGGARSRSRMRGTVPANAGKPWSDEEDRRLLTEFDRGRPLAELAQSHARTPAGIQARLEKHGRLQVRPGDKPSYYVRANDRRFEDQNSRRGAPSRVES